MFPSREAIRQHEPPSDVAGDSGHGKILKKYQFGDTTGATNANPFNLTFADADTCQIFQSNPHIFGKFTQK